jgi:hypothetical protein
MGEVTLPVTLLLLLQVVEVGYDDRGPKIGCSMKLVDQADGTDLDPQVRLRALGVGVQGFRSYNGIVTLQHAQPKLTIQIPTT